MVITKYLGCGQAQMLRRLRMGNPFGLSGSDRQNGIYALECRREITRLYPNGEGGKTLFSLAEEITQ